MNTISAKNWNDYELIDSGDGLRLERFGAYTTIRPDPNVIWPRSDSQEALWDAADARFLGGEEKWQLHHQKLEKGWPIQWNDLKVLVKPTAFRHLGLFPEQVVHWEWLQSVIKEADRPVKVLNLFAYTGASTIVGALAGADVTHVDASKSTVFWASDNAKLSGVQNKIRWIVDDVVKFLRREVKRGSTYDLILMDPPVFGRGPKGEIWRLGENVPYLFELTRQLLTDRPIGILVNFYATELYPFSILRLAETYFAKTFPDLSLNALMLEEKKNKKQLATGFFLRS